MELIGIAGLVTIIWKVVDVLRFAANKDWSALVTQGTVYLSALAVALLAREAEPFQAVEILGTTFGELDFAAVVLFALGIGSTASGVVDFKQAIDSTDSAVVPRLVDTRPVVDHHPT
jgi:hypothetical protein